MLHVPLIILTIADFCVFCVAEQTTLKRTVSTSSTVLHYHTRKHIRRHQNLDQN